MSGREALRGWNGPTPRDVGQRQAHLLWEQDIGGSSPLIPTNDQGTTNNGCAAYWQPWSDLAG